MISRPPILLPLLLAAALLCLALLLRPAPPVLSDPALYGMDEVETMESRVFHNLVSQCWDLSSLRMERGDPASALRSCRALRSLPQVRRLAGRRGIFKELNAAVGNALDLRVLALELSRGAYDKALRWADEVLASDPSREVKARIHLARGEILGRYGASRLAASELEAGLRIVEELLREHRRNEYLVHRELPAVLPSPLAKPWLLRLVCFQNLTRDPSRAEYCWGSWEPPDAEDALSHIAASMRERAAGRQAYGYVACARPAAPLTTPYLLGGVPNSDSSIDLLGQAGLISNAWPRFPAAQPDAYMAWLRGCVDEMNGALEKEDFAAVDRSMAAMASRIRRDGGPMAGPRLRRARNELIRLCVAHGEYGRAAAMAGSLLAESAETRRILNREAVLHHLLGRIAREKGDYARAEREIRTALERSLATLEEVSRLVAGRAHQR